MVGNFFIKKRLVYKKITIKFVAPLKVGKMS